MALHRDEALAKTDQIGLPLRLKDRASFENFLAGDNQQIVALLEGSGADRDLGVIYLHGAKGAGKSHLLQAFCKARSRSSPVPAYRPVDWRRICLTRSSRRLDAPNR